jgi:hypothetical protein
LSSYDDDIEFDFFDEPETVEAAPRGRRPRAPRPGGDGPRRPPMRAPTGLVPLARLVGLIAIAIVVVVAFVFWVGACQGKSKHDEYASYANTVRAIAQSSSSLGTDFANKLISTGASLKLSDLETSLQQFAQQEQQAYDAAQQIRPPGPLRAIHQRLIDALELRAKGLAGLGNELAQAPPKPNAQQTADETNALTAQGELLTASDVVWDELYRLPAKQQLQSEGVTGVIVPESHFVSTPELLSARSFGLLLQRLGAATTSGSSSSGSGTTTGPHGDALLSVVATPGSTTLSPTAATTVKVSAALAFVATVKDSGNFPEYNVPVTLTISAGGSPIVQTKKILVIQPAQTTALTFTGFNLPTSAFGNKATVKVSVAPVAGEINVANNSATYTVFFTLG